MIINGKIIPLENADAFDVRDPSNGTKIGSVPIATQTQVMEAVDNSVETFRNWRKTNNEGKTNILAAATKLLRSNANKYAHLISSESGKPIKQAHYEVELSEQLLDNFTHYSRNISGELPQSTGGEINMILKNPIGPVAIISSYNYPLYLMLVKLAPAISAGCTVIVKPSELCPLTCLEFLKDLNEYAPKGVINLITGNGDTGKCLVSSFGIRKVCFTGQVGTGLKILNGLSDIKSITYELGGVNPAVVDSSVDNLKKVATIVRDFAFRNAGQYCHRVCHCYIHNDVYDVFIKELLDQVNTLKIGRYDEEDVYYGPLISKELIELVDSRVKDAVSKGAKLLAGGQVKDSYFYLPTVIENISPDMDVFDKETFGPVLSVNRFESLDSAIELLNQSKFGLSSYFFSNSLDNINNFMVRIETGQVHVNNISRSFQLPFGGHKNSGTGRERSQHSISEFLYLKSINISTKI